MRDKTLLRRYQAGQRHFRGVKVRGGFLGLKSAALAGADLREIDLREADRERLAGWQAALLYQWAALDASGL